MSDINGYELAEEIFINIGKNSNYEISIDDAIRVISFWGFNEESSKSSKIGFVCSCAREKVEKILEEVLVYGRHSSFDELVKKINNFKQ